MQHYLFHRVEALCSIITLTLDKQLFATLLQQSQSYIFSKMNRSSSANVSATEVGPFFDLASDFMCILDEKGVCVQVNQAFVRGLGYSAQWLRDRALSDLAYPDDRDSIQTCLKRLDTGEDTVSFTYRYVTKDDQVLWLDWTVSRVETTSGNRLYGVAKDITQARYLQSQLTQQTRELAAAVDKYTHLLQAERQASLRASAAETQRKLYADATHNMPVGLSIWRLERLQDATSLRLVTTNPAYTEFTGVPLEVIANKPILDAFPALAGTDTLEQYAEVVRTGQKRNLGDVVYGDDRVEKSIFTVKAFPLPDSCVGIVFDNVTLHKKLEVLRHEQEAQLRVMFQQANVGMARLSAAGKWMQVNRHLCSFLGYSAETLLQKTFFDLIHPDDQAAVRSMFQRLLSADSLTDDQPNAQSDAQSDAQMQNAHGEIENRCVTAEGETVWTLSTLSAIRNQQGKLLYFIAAVQDITKLKETLLALKSQKNSLLTTNLTLTHTMRTLEQRNEELDQFAYVTSHDLKAPLRAIANLATWIEEDLGSQLPAENAEQFELLKNRVHRMEGLINGLLEYSRIGRTHQSSEQVDVAALLEEVVDSLPTEGFTIMIAPDMPKFQAKRSPLSQVFSNLINNAIKHHHRSDGSVEVGVKDLGALYQFTVKDDGPGIAAAFHEKVFTIFQTLRSRDDLESTGIGLSLVKKTVLAEGGEIKIFSKGEPGEGATFQFTWPKIPNVDDRYLT